MILRKPNDLVRDTGDATAEDGGIAVSGYVRELTVQTGERIKARSGYLDRVRQIAPDRLLERDAEYNELARFCTAADPAPSYLWWRAAAWAGKSALMSWFVLNPPDGIQVVPFFVTARWAGQSDRVAFAEVLIEQLAELLGEPLPALLSDATRESHLTNMLVRAAKFCRDRGQRLVLAVDGLDEDQGVTSGDDAYSIAALLPERPVAGMRVVVAGRPNPPIPTDVPDCHQLRDISIIRELVASPHAAVLRDGAQRELKRLIGGRDAEQNLLGFLTAAGGGLSGDDLAELSLSSRVEIADYLDSVPARTFTPRNGRWKPTTVYVLGHEELQRLAVDRLGADRLRRYRERIHAWAARYRDLGWPVTTPEYLMRGYFPLVQATGTLGQVLALATDTARHDRMLDMTGGDTTSLAEITAAQNLLLERGDVGEAELSHLLRLANHRSRIQIRNRNIPVQLPAVWVKIGQPTRAQALAQGITAPSDRRVAILGLVEALAAKKNLDEAERLSQEISDLGDRERALVAVVSAAEADQARRIAQVFTGAVSRTSASIAQADMSGDEEQARLLADAALETALAVESRSERNRAITAVIDLYARLGDLQRAHDLLREVEEAARDEPLSRLARQSMLAGDVDQAIKCVVNMKSELLRVTSLQEIVHADATAVLARLDDPYQRTQAMLQVALGCAKVGNLERARTTVLEAAALVDDIADSHNEILSLIEVAQAFADLGDVARAKEYTAAAQTLLSSTHLRLDQEQEAPKRLARVLINLRDFEQAEVVVAEITRSPVRDRVRSELAVALVLMHEMPAAQKMIHSIVDHLQRDSAWGKIAVALAKRGYTDRAMEAMRALGEPAISRVRLELVPALVQGGAFHAAARLASSCPKLSDRARALTSLAQALADAGLFDRAQHFAEEAESAARAITDPADEALTTATLARSLHEAGETLRAESLATTAETIAKSIADPYDHAEVMAQLALQLARTGRTSEAVRIVRSIGDPYKYELTLARLVIPAAGTAGASRAEGIMKLLGSDYLRERTRVELSSLLIRSGDLAGAERLAGGIEDLYERAQILAVLAETTAAEGDADRAQLLARRVERISDKLDDTYERARTLALAAQSLACAGKQADALALAQGAKALTSSLGDPYMRTKALATLAQCLARGGDIPRARSEADAAEEVARAIPIPGQRDDVLAWLVQSLARAGEAFDAERIALTIKDDTKRATALAWLTELLASEGRLPHAERVAGSIGNRPERVKALASMVRLMAESGRAAEAGRYVQAGEQCATSLEDKNQQALALATLASAMGRPSSGRFLGAALVIAPWEIALPSLASLYPGVVVENAQSLSAPVRTFHNEPLLADIDDLLT
ncbi:hypothetical protein [Actinoplanes sp. N902-109]|uniref:hypothetical protein n=1 Tax=Actinoplanes sp. (strain N902-109) TaxID=649831 RepID=UPI0003293E61|nr:hypothetical protein [Actinoplanes sp. N902-109]AGL16088.1 hypothetical protein L083_2578 [Actinoplanes sp. N902-109]